jgi:hypothetical protein
VSVLADAAAHEKAERLIHALSQAKISERDTAMVAAEQMHLDSMGHVRKQLEDVSSDLTAAQASEARLAQQVERCESIWDVVYHAN